MLDFHWDTTQVKYDPAYVTPPGGWQVEFDGCHPGGPYTYAWTIDGGAVTSTADPCKVIYRFYIAPGVQAAHSVTLTVTGTQGQHASMTHKIVPRNWLIVSIGDSYSSGQGAPDVPQQLDGQFVVKAIPRWEDRRCDRSGLSGPAQAALAIEREDPWTSVTFLSFACSGAGVYSGLTGPYKGAEPPNSPYVPTATAGSGRPRTMPPSNSDVKSANSELRKSDPLRADTVFTNQTTPSSALLLPQVWQVEGAVGRRPIDALIISIGLNDIGFSDILKQCFLGAAVVAGAAVGGPCSKQYLFKAGVVAKLDSLRSKYDSLDKMIRDDLNVSRVYLSEYPNPLNDQDGKTCGTAPGGHRSLEITPRSGIDPQSVVWLRDTVAAGLNKAVHDAAARHSWQVDEIWSKFARHGECADNNNRWINTEEDARRTVGPYYFVDQDHPNLYPSSGTMHPNPAGQAAHAASLASLLRRTLSNTPVVFVKLCAHAMAGIPCPVTVEVYSPGGGAIPAKVRFDYETALFDANTPLVHTFHGNGTAHYVSVAPTGDYNEAAATFRVPLQPLTVRVDPFPVTPRVPTDVTVHLTDAAGKPVDGTVSLQDPPASRPGPAAPAPQTYRTNAPITGHVFQANLHILHHRDGSVCTVVIATTGMVVPRDSVDYENTSKDVKFIENQGAGCEGP